MKLVLVSARVWVLPIMFLFFFPFPWYTPEQKTKVNEQILHALVVILRAMNVVDSVAGSDVVVFWLDHHICEDRQCKDLKQKFQEGVGHKIEFFDKVEPCYELLENSKGKKLFCIIQGRFAESIVPLIRRQATVPPVIYIFCLSAASLKERIPNVTSTLDDCVFDHELDLLCKMTADLADYATVKSQEYLEKRAACNEWAQTATKNAKRFRLDKDTLTFRTDPFTDEVTPAEQPFAEEETSTEQSSWIFCFFLSVSPFQKIEYKQTFLPNRSVQSRHFWKCLVTTIREYN